MADRPARCVRSDEERALSVITQIAETIRIGALTAIPGRSTSFVFDISLGDDGRMERVNVCGGPCLPAVPKEVIRAHFDHKSLMASPLPCRDLLRLSVEPYLIGVGWVEVHDTPEGVVVLRSDNRKETGCHTVSIGKDIEITSEMIEAGVERIESMFLSIRRPSGPEIFEEAVRAIFVAMRERQLSQGI